ncbi:hypothetical protein [Desertivirga arenae]|uniref:hypothetical protein n=1 Tax=Desertivirga arenae TaxID=2810309 RepID=UPI001A965244|nr:hypothetical protein [Pedobacter sp. SYSU D00823]
MKNNYVGVRQTTPVFGHFNHSFTVRYKGVDGLTLHGYVTQLSANDYQVFVKEKGVIIQCKKDEYGLLTCKLNSKGNVHWVDGISRAVAQTLLEQ